MNCKTGTKSASTSALMNTHFDPHLDPDFTSQTASQTAPHSSRVAPRLPRETIPTAPPVALPTTPLTSGSLATSAPEADTSSEKADGRSFILWACLVLLAAFALIWLGAWSAQRPSQTPVVGPIKNRNPVAKPVVVHVAGAVKKPGVYSLKSGERIYDAIQKAGGATSQADAHALNLAALAQDGTKIEVPTKLPAAPRLAAKPVESTTATLKLPTELSTSSAVPNVAETEAGETPDDDVPFASKKAASQTPAPLTKVSSSTRTTTKPKTATKTTAKPRAKKEKSKTIAGLPRAVTASGEMSDNASPEFLAKNPLDLNRITQEQLEALPGVGPSLASRILQYRKQNGGFKSVAELDNVKGIGEKKFEELRPLLRVEGEIAKEVANSAAVAQTPTPSPN